MGLAAKRRGLSCLIVEKGAICNTVFRFPQHMRFFSTADLLEFPGIPFAIDGDKPLASEVLNYFTRIAISSQLSVSTFERVVAVKKVGDEFRVTTSKRLLNAPNIVFAVGTYDHPNLLGVHGEDLPHVLHYYSGPHTYIGRKVLIVGGKNSAAEAALDLWRKGAHVTIVHRADTLNEQSIKYWILPDLKNRIEDGAIEFLANTVVSRIENERVEVRNPNGTQWIENDDVLALTGYHPDYEFLAGCGIEFEGAARSPIHNPETLETNIPGLFIAGVVNAGANPSRIFIENSRHHGEMILNCIGMSAVRG